MTSPVPATGAAWKKATPRGKPGANLLAAGRAASLSLKDSVGPNGRVNFRYPPQKISISHAAKLQEISPPKKNAATTPQSGDTPGLTDPVNSDDGATLGYDDKIKAAGATTIGVNELIFVGDGVVNDCAKLLAWSNAQYQGCTTAPALPKLTFSWGVQRYLVNLIQVDITYERFTAGGKPIQAKANLRLQQLDDTPPGTNPTSGGIPGRRGHTLVAGENLQHIATANYGRPGAWRALAAANGIEDPLAVRPGMVIYLPARAELGNGSPR